MGYERQNFTDNLTVLTAEHMVNIENGIIANEESIQELSDKVDNIDTVEGKSAYEVWLEQGNEGTEEDFFNSLKGDAGSPLSAAGTESELKDLCLNSPSSPIYCLWLGEETEFPLMNDNFVLCVPGNCYKFVFKKAGSAVLFTNITFVTHIGNGANGEDGVSPTVTVDDIDGGYRINITHVDGEDTIDIMHGSVPEKGVDYFTDEDKSEIIQETAELIDVPTKVSELTNDEDYITGADVDSKISEHNGAGYAHIDIRADVNNLIVRMNAQESMPKPAYTPDEIGADPEGTAASKVAEHNANPDAHSDIRTLVANKLDASKLTEGINTALAQAKASGEFNGKDGTSITITGKTESSISGGVNKITFSNGETLSIKNGTDGVNGNDGYTPKKGTDYFTPADITEMVNNVIATLPTTEGVGF